MAWEAMGESGLQSSTRDYSRRSVLVMRARRLAASEILVAVGLDKANDFRVEFSFFSAIFRECLGVYITCYILNIEQCRGSSTATFRKT